MSESRDRTPGLDEAQRREAEHERGAMDPGLKEQFERDHTVVRMHPSATPAADALQRPHYEPRDDGTSEDDAASRD
jgi:hypothetical protein